MEHSVYVHIPFCQVRCAYCDFNTYAGLEGLVPAYVDALSREIRQVGASAPERPLPVGTIFLGGGTPSLLSVDQAAAILQAIRESFALSPGAEVTLEANPGTVDADLLQGLRRLGFNRISFGVQSAHESELRLLDRLHSFEQAREAVHIARSAAFEDVNLDLIYGIMGQTMSLWQATVERALELEPDHLSLYALTLEHGTPMQARVEQGLLPEPDPDLAADEYEWAEGALHAAGFVHYEISNWAKVDAADGRARSRHVCRHNLQTWRNAPYLGFGAGAHGFAAGWRYADVRSPQAYIRAMATPAVLNFPFSPALAEKHSIDTETEMRETVMLGMRLVEEGVSAAEYRVRFAVDLREAFASQWTKLERDGLVAWEGERVRLTERGRLLGNRVFLEFV